ncbi:WbqC family protein [Streptomyces sp. NBC_01451]|uniref:WbqC family protein n=1 Tax=Streptomyces sp. NBC_01451 TaxID=2903872 RepID=UPI002E327909|nr:WbqC family protein [Streptomyces sp. NBC_01451]
MTPTSAFYRPDSTAASSAPDPLRTGARNGVCAIHQPNLFPRLSTLAKLYAADRWIVLDNVQFARRDYQHRTRLAALDAPDRQQWLTLPVNLPQGRPTLISQALLAEPSRSRRTAEPLIRQYYGRSRHWPVVRTVLDTVLARLADTDSVADIAETSTRVLLDSLGWRGEVLYGSTFPARPGRSARLADLALATGSTHYLCGSGGMRYLDPEPFGAHGIPVLPFRTPVDDGDPLWRLARRVSSLWALSSIGPQALAARMNVGRQARSGPIPGYGKGRGPKTPPETTETPAHGQTRQ